MTALDTLASNLATLHAIRNGERKIVNDEWLDWLNSHDPDGTAMKIKTIPNPGRVGILDQYVAFIGPNLPTRAKFMEEVRAALVRNQPRVVTTGQIDRFMASVHKTLQGEFTVIIDSQSFKEAWKACGLKGKPTYKLMHQFPE